ncbi:MAG: UDP-2,3-diacylglucosamine diphosphatase LpxI [Elusimicrobia bacterium]|nr:UDP-2,3-diacylglucosamine diphosphatase LpxI [Elusimicrobiota bacterium]
MIGLIAGNGNFPLIFTRQAKKRGEKVIAIALFDETDKTIESIADKTYWINVGQLSKLIEILKKEKIEKCIMAGQVKHTKLFSVKPDLKALALLAKLKSKTADSLLSAVCSELEREGIKFIPSNTYLSDFIPKAGLLTKRKPDKTQKEDIEFGYKIAREVAHSDIGQTICVKDKSIVAVEAMEGTDECIRRAGEITKDFVVIKAARPNQDMRFDIPIVGLKTIETLKNAKSSVMAVESDKTLILEMDEVIKFANENEICILAIK